MTKMEEVKTYTYIGKDQRFQAFLEKVAAIVGTWPKWKKVAGGVDQYERRER